MDSFTKSRLQKAVRAHRKTCAEWPTLKDLEKLGFSKKETDIGVKEKWLIQLYVNMTSGAVVKVFKVSE